MQPSIDGKARNNIMNKIILSACLLGSMSLQASQCVKMESSPSVSLEKQYEYKFMRDIRVCGNGLIRLSLQLWHNETARRLVQNQFFSLKSIKHDEGKTAMKLEGHEEPMQIYPDSMGEEDKRVMYKIFEKACVKFLNGTVLDTFNQMAKNKIGTTFLFNVRPDSYEPIVTLEKDHGE